MLHRSKASRGSLNSRVIKTRRFFHMFNLWFGVLFLRPLHAVSHFLPFIRQDHGLCLIGIGNRYRPGKIIKTINLQIGTLLHHHVLGNTMYGTIYLASDLLNEKYGEADAKKAVWFGFFTLIASTIIMQMALLFNPAEPGLEAQAALQSIFACCRKLHLAAYAPIL